MNIIEAQKMLALINGALTTAESAKDGDVDLSGISNVFGSASVPEVTAYIDLANYAIATAQRMKKDFVDIIGLWRSSGLPILETSRAAAHKAVDELGEEIEKKGG